MISETELSLYEDIGMLCAISNLMRSCNINDTLCEDHAGELSDRQVAAAMEADLWLQKNQEIVTGFIHRLRGEAP